ncbi:hypothetical protein GQ42DRAFT_71891 [Ramicandelaber brevisporus]|nr:hypothetical protein GQ42DRAFT_71891 [Ramicandelaber brevisporus]
MASVGTAIATTPAATAATTTTVSAGDDMHSVRSTMSNRGRKLELLAKDPLAHRTERGIAAASTQIGGCGGGGDDALGGRRLWSQLPNALNSSGGRVSGGLTNDPDRGYYNTLDENYISSHLKDKDVQRRLKQLEGNMSDSDRESYFFATAHMDIVNSTAINNAALLEPIQSADLAWGNQRVRAILQRKGGIDTLPMLDIGHWAGQAEIEATAASMMPYDADSATQKILVDRIREYRTKIDSKQRAKVGGQLEDLAAKLMWEIEQTTDQNRMLHRALSVLMDDYPMCHTAAKPLDGDTLNEVAPKTILQGVANWVAEAEAESNECAEEMKSALHDAIQAARKLVLVSDERLYRLQQIRRRILYAIERRDILRRVLRRRYIVYQRTAAAVEGAAAAANGYEQH